MSVSLVRRRIRRNGSFSARRICFVQLGGDPSFLELLHHGVDCLFEGGGGGRGLREEFGGMDLKGKVQIDPVLRCMDGHTHIASALEDRSNDSSRGFL